MTNEEFNELELLRTETFEANGRSYLLEMCATGGTDNRGCETVAYRLQRNLTDKPIFLGADFHGSPLHATDSDESVVALMGFLTLRPGDTDSEYFESYTPEQLEWAETEAEELSCAVTEWARSKGIED